ncbi:adenylate kinase [Agrococcus sp. SL85]|uniref:adenylate kinase n=1 Tax=Agrococcus sp. SL85 TaxID=2995141 RepID=UPI00226CC69E|nr:adenylate kinase [Agrococcus sp. SL85]WAC66591.1 adenylate kinase [Agrococcus sp. SL85]
MSAGSIDDVRSARRILCFGATGSGKSTLATALGERLGLPVVLIDEIAWQPGWRQLDREELGEVVLPLLDGEGYVFDSVYGGQNADALARVDVVVALDYPRAVSLARLVRRTWRRIRTRELVCNGNVETLGRVLSADSIVAWHVRSWRSKRERMRRWHADPAAPPVLLLPRPADARALLDALPAGSR